MGTLSSYLFVSALIFCIGILGVLLRRNILIIFMSIEMMLNAVNLTFVAFSRMMGTVEGQVFVFLSMAISACEVALGLAVILLVFRRREEVDVDSFNLLKD